MKIAFYSTGGIDPASPFSSRHYLFPRKRTEWDSLAEMWPDDTICVYCTGSATHMIDIAGGELLEPPGKVRYIMLPGTATIEEIADRIAADGVDAAIAYSLPDVTFDWYPVRDSLVGEALKERGIRVIAHPAETSQRCLEKRAFREFLTEHGFNCAKGVYIHGEMFFSERRYPMIVNNVYREYIRSRISTLRFPVIIKSAAGSGSVGVYAVNNVEDAMQQLSRAEIPRDMLAEEMLEDVNFGIEIFGSPEGYYVSDPIRFSPSENGITDPFSSIKSGPVKDAAFAVDELKSELKRLAKLLGLCGIAEADLIFSGGKWYILEINPRFSLLSQAVAAMEGINPFSLLMETAHGSALQTVSPEGTPLHVIDFKSRAFPDEEIVKIRAQFPAIRHVMRFLYGLPGGGSVSYCDWLIGAESDEALLRCLASLREAYPEVVSPEVIQNALTLIKKDPEVSER